MKAQLHFAALVALAAIGLVFQADSQATDLARQPLNATTLARPAVLFAMDDSGSIAFVAKQFNKSRKAIRAYLRFNRDIEKVGPVRLKSCRD